MSHNGTLEMLENDDFVSAYLDIKNSGMTKAIGVSVYTLEESLAAINSGVWDLVQVPFNLMDQRQRAAFEAADEKGVGIVVRSVLLKGILTGKGSNLHPELRTVEQHREKYMELLSPKAPTLAKLAAKFVLSQKGVTSVLIGIDKMQYLEEALNVVDGNYLDQQELDIANKLAYPDPEFLDLPKWDRLGWLK
jgi:aryl-alcohol dehydrogenase-like predicted oxidoreductase